MAVYLGSNNAVFAYGDGCGYIVIKQRLPRHGLWGEVRLPIDHFQRLFWWKEALEDEASEGSPDLDELEDE